MKKPTAKIIKFRPEPKAVPAVCPVCYGNAGLHFDGCKAQKP